MIGLNDALDAIDGFIKLPRAQKTLQRFPVSEVSA